MPQRHKIAPLERCPPRFLDLAGRLADAAGIVSRRYFRTRIKVIEKGNSSPVTIADREAEARMREMIAREYPDHGIMGEEHGLDRIDAEHVWVLDPIDGTKSFICGVPLFGTLIALVRRGVPILGIIDQPVIGERWVGAAGRVTTYLGKKATTRPCRTLADATLFATSPYMFGTLTPAFESLRTSVKLTRYGTDCYGYGQVVAGNADIVVEGGLKPHDYLAQVPIFEGAGGVLTDWEGQALGLYSGGRICGSGDPKLHKQVLRKLQG
ncbi:MAG: histidinol-phosphatase [Alphaproteobacteria bacterium]|nr:histidinol-phosphatase [Alphaproteobacteria bacterium]